MKSETFCVCTNKSSVLFSACTLVLFLLFCKQQLPFFLYFCEISLSVVLLCLGECWMNPSGDGFVQSRTEMKSVGSRAAGGETLQCKASF